MTLFASVYITYHEVILARVLTTTTDTYLFSLVPSGLIDSGGQPQLLNGEPVMEKDVRGLEKVYTLCLVLHL